MWFELWRRVKEEVFERWDEQTCSLNPAKPPEPVTIEAEGIAAVQGLRHRLQVSKLFTNALRSVKEKVDMVLSCLT